ncbi:transcriptional repressor QapR [Pseudonocardia ailaonensis]|uniref:Transcriptional repressor QapR n=1 Tax=Pseudonocardia ailaonensis TaxID=367279 RepID=A0ABN2MIK3_9PSEU
MPHEDSTVAEEPRPGTVASVAVADRIRAVMGEVSPAERRVARALLSKYPTAGLESTAALAERAGASPPTVVRFIARLGVGGYRDFQQLLREEVQQRRASPLTQLPRLDVESPSSDLQAVSIEVFEHEISNTLAALPLSELGAAVDLLAAKQHRITGIGGRFSYLLAEYLDLHLRVMRPDTRTHPMSPHRDGPLVLDASRRDVFVVFDFRRYQRDVVDLARALHDKGAQILLVTDPWLSPVAEVANVVLPARVQGPSPFDSLVSATALVEVLVAGLHAKLGTSAATRIRQADELTGDISLP